MTLLWILVLLAAVAVGAIGVRLLRKRGLIARLAGISCFLVSVVGVAASGYAQWFLNRGQPPAIEEAWFDGVTYQRIVRTEPRPIVAHVVRVDLTRPGIRLLVTPPDFELDLPLQARTTSAFAAEHKVQLAINANFYLPFSASNPLSYYPHAGDRVQVAGFAAAGGTIYHADRWRHATFYIAADGDVGFEQPAGGKWSAISGNGFLLRDGKAVNDAEGELPLYARTALGLDSARKMLMLVVVEGKQPGRSEGVTIPELSDLMLAAGAHTAINLDGGGSSTLVRQTAEREWSRMNCTSNFEMPWWERPVANHLGVFSRPLRAP